MNHLLLAAADPAAPSTMSSIMSFLPLVLIIVVMYFFMIRPQRKKEKEIQEMRSKIEVGDEIITSGGIIGRVVSIREDSVVIESGSDRSKIRIARWAIQQNNATRDSASEAK